MEVVVHLSKFIIAAFVIAMTGSVDSAPASPDASPNASAVPSTSSALERSESARCGQYRCLNTGELDILKTCVATCTSTCVMDCS